MNRGLDQVLLPQLQGGQLISVPSSLIPRQKQHFTDLAGTGEQLRSQLQQRVQGSTIIDEQSSQA